MLVKKIYSILIKKNQLAKEVENLDHQDLLREIKLMYDNRTR